MCARLTTVCGRLCACSVAPSNANEWAKFSSQVVACLALAAASDRAKILSPTVAALEASCFVVVHVFACFCVHALCFVLSPNSLLLLYCYLLLLFSTVANPQKLLLTGALTGVHDATSGKSLVDAAVDIIADCFQPAVDDEALLVQVVKVRRCLQNC